jgi:multidrug efflux pump subunit AcrA (membrane-fusion protein)
MPGAYAEVHLKASAPISSLIIPSQAVLYQAAGPQVAVATDKNEIALKKVTLGRDFGDTVEVISGLSKNDAVVASPPDYLVDGMRVEVQSPKSGTEN